MGLSELMILGSPLPAAGLLLAAATFVAFRTLARRRVRNETQTGRRDGERVRPSPRSIPLALAQFHSQLQDLADEVDVVLPRKFRLIDQWILDGDREIARLQRHLAAVEPVTTSVSLREPDVLLFDEVEPNRNAVPAVLRFENRKIRRAA